MRDDAIDEYILKIQQADWLARKDQHGVRCDSREDVELVVDRVELEREADAVLVLAGEPVCLQDLEQAVRASCAACTARCAVAVRQSSLARSTSDLAGEPVCLLDLEDVLVDRVISHLCKCAELACGYSFRLPLQFDSVDDELNILA
jgi:hypothetical protein